MVSDPKVESFWRTQYQNFQVSNLSRSIFCRNNNLTLHQSFYWFKKIKLIDEEKSKTSNNFIPVKYEKKDDESIFEFSVNNQKISFSKLPEPKYLAELIKCLQ